MAEDPFLVSMKEVTDVGDELKEAYAEVDDVKASGNLTRSLPTIPDYVLNNIVNRLEDARDIARVMSACRCLRSVVKARQGVAKIIAVWQAFGYTSGVGLTVLDTLFSEDRQPPLIGGRRVADAIVVSAVVLLSFVYFYLIGYIDRGGSKAGSSGSLDFRDISISILLFQAAYVWIKFREVISRRAVYQRPGSSKWEPRIKFPVMRGMGGKSKRISLGSYDTKAEGEIAYQIAAFYCNKSKHRLGRLDLGEDAYFSIPTLSLDPSLPYEEKVKQVGDQVLKVYAEFVKRRASRSLPPSVPRLALEMPTEESQLLATSSIQQLRQPVNLGMDSAMQYQSSQLDPNIHNRIDFNDPGCFLPVLAKTQHELLDAHKQIECLKAQVSRMEVENMEWEIKHSELERENGLLNHQITQLQSQLQSHHQEQQFDTNRFMSMGHKES